MAKKTTVAQIHRALSNFSVVGFPSYTQKLGVSYAQVKSTTTWTQKSRLTKKPICFRSQFKWYPRREPIMGMHFDFSTLKEA